LSTKENISYIKEQLSAQERILENLFHFERFYKKHKIKIFILLTLVVLGVVGLYINDSINQENIEKSNKSFNNLINDKYTQNDIDILKKYNKKLYDVYQVHKILKSKDTNTNISLDSSLDILADLMEYQKSLLTKKTILLEKYSLKQKSILKDFAILNEAFLLVKRHKIQEANDKLRFISSTSKVHKFVVLLQHYMLTKK
jgi:hypothetical protein